MKNFFQNRGNKKWLVSAFFLLPVLLTIFQIMITSQTLFQIRGEELLESVTGVYWFDHRSVFYGAYTNVGWYMILSLIYHLFGFSLFTARYYRIVLHLVSLLSAALILKKYVGIKKSFIPLIAIGLSPTLLYFNAMEAEFAIDMQYFPICFLLIDWLPFKKKVLPLCLHFFVFSFVMIAWMSYPSFLYSVIAMLGWYAFRLRKEFRKHSIRVFQYVGIDIAGFLTPILFATLFIQNRQFLWYDPYTKNGIFRGAGSFSFHSDFFKNITSLLRDFFLSGHSYYFELKQVEFSWGFPVLSLLIIGWVTVLLIKTNKFRIILVSLVVLSIFSIIVGNFTLDPSNMPGIRRYTWVLTVVYILFIFSWNYVSSHKFKQKITQKILLLILLLLPLHSLVVFPLNLLQMREKSSFAETFWFNREGKPENVVFAMAEKAQTENLVLKCTDNQGNPLNCRFSEIYAAVAGFCEWNRLECHQIAIFNPYTQQTIPLSVDLWNNYTFNH